MIHKASGKVREVWHEVGMGASLIIPPAGLMPFLQDRSGVMIRYISDEVASEAIHSKYGKMKQLRTVVHGAEYVLVM